jgi:DNA-directed RNA polymerase specialized sigma24 family protein
VETARQRQLEDLCRRFRPALVAYFLRRVSDPAEAEDLAHDVLLRLTGIPPEQLKSADAYVFQVATNLLKDRAEGLSRRQPGPSLAWAHSRARLLRKWIGAAIRSLKEESNG